MSDWEDGSSEGDDNGWRIRAKRPMGDTVYVKLLPKRNAPTIKWRNVPGLQGIEWALTISVDETQKNVFLFDVHLAGGSATVTGELEVRGHSESFVCHFTEAGQSRLNNRIYGPRMVGAQLTCSVSFELKRWTKMASMLPLTIQDMIDPDDSRCSDASITVGEDSIKINRGFMSMISPVFCAAFGPDTKESQTGILDIKDFSFDTVESAVKYCYGEVFEDKTADEVIDMLRFYDKYDIPAAIKKLEFWLADNMTIQNFVSIVQYSWLHERESLQAKCGAFFHSQAKHVACRSDFGNLDPAVIAGVVKAGVVAGSEAEKKGYFGRAPPADYLMLP